MKRHGSKRLREILFRLKHFLNMILNADGYLTGFMWHGRAEIP